MSTGIATARAHERDALIADVILASEPDVWRTPGEWWLVANRADVTYPRAAIMQPATVAVVLRRLARDGDMDTRRNPDDARSTQYRVTP